MSSPSVRPGSGGTRSFLTRRGSGGRRSETRRRVFADRFEQHNCTSESVSAGRRLGFVQLSKHAVSMQLSAPSSSPSSSILTSSVHFLNGAPLGIDTPKTPDNPKINDQSFHASRLGRKSSGYESTSNFGQSELKSTSLVVRDDQQQSPLPDKFEFKFDGSAGSNSTHDDSVFTPSCRKEVHEVRDHHQKLDSASLPMSPNMEYARILGHRSKVCLPADNIVDKERCKDYLDSNHWRYFSEPPNKNGSADRNASRSEVKSQRAPTSQPRTLPSAFLHPREDIPCTTRVPLPRKEPEIDLSQIINEGGAPALPTECWDDVKDVFAGGPDRNAEEIPGCSVLAVAHPLPHDTTHPYRPVSAVITKENPLEFFSIKGFQRWYRLHDDGRDYSIECLDAAIQHLLLPQKCSPSSEQGTVRVKHSIGDGNMPHNDTFEDVDDNSYYIGMDCGTGIDRSYSNVKTNPFILDPEIVISGSTTPGPLLKSQLGRSSRLLEAATPPEFSPGSPGDLEAAPVNKAAVARFPGDEKRGRVAETQARRVRGILSKAKKAREIHQQLLDDQCRKVAQLMEAREEKLQQEDILSQLIDDIEPILLTNIKTPSIESKEIYASTFNPETGSWLKEFAKPLAEISAHTETSHKLLHEQIERDRIARLKMEEQERIRLEKAQKLEEEKRRAEEERKLKEAQAQEVRRQQLAAKEAEAEQESYERRKAMFEAAKRKEDLSAEAFVSSMIDAHDKNAKLADAFYLKGRKSAVDTENKALAKALRFALKDSLMAWTKRAVTNTLKGTPNDEGFLVTMEKVLAIPDPVRREGALAYMRTRVMMTIFKGIAAKEGAYEHTGTDQYTTAMQKVFVRAQIVVEIAADRDPGMVDVFLGRCFKEPQCVCLAPLAMATPNVITANDWMNEGQGNRGNQWRARCDAIGRTSAIILACMTAPVVFAPSGKLNPFAKHLWRWCARLAQLEPPQPWMIVPLSMTIDIAGSTLIQRYLGQGKKLIKALLQQSETVRTKCEIFKHPTEAIRKAYEAHNDILFCQKRKSELRSEGWECARVPKEHLSFAPNDV